MPEREKKTPARGKERKRNENRAEIKLGTKRLYFSDRLFGENGKCEPKNHQNAEREREQGDMKKKCTMEMEHYGLRNESNRSKCSNICALSVEK